MEEKQRTLKISKNDLLVFLIILNGMVQLNFQVDRVGIWGIFNIKRIFFWIEQVQPTTHVDQADSSAARM